MKTSTTNQLPLPEPLSLMHTEKVQAHLRKLIARQGPIPFSSYMREALYAPGLGYYSAGTTKLGKMGDFTTAPEISSLFGQCIAKQAAQFLSANPHSDLLEFGAGSGKLAADILLFLEKINALPHAYYILEVSADLRERQKTYLKNTVPQLFSSIIWLDQLPKEPLNAVIIANEVLDAMPVEIFNTNDNNHCQQAYVDYKEGSFYTQWQSAEKNLLRAFNQLDQQWSNHFISEINLMVTPWVNSLADCLNQGIILLIDYGFTRREYYHPDRSMGTLMCHYQHRSHTNPYLFPGIQDITAHVDFTAVANAGLAAGLSLAGFTHQAGFLINCGIIDFLNTEKKDAVDQYNLNQQLLMLTSPNEMGELFKAMAFTKNFSEDLLGFFQFEQSYRLFNNA